MALQREEFARRLRELREERRLTQDEVAHKAGVSLRQYLRWETQRSMPYFSSIEKLAAALDVDPELLTVEPGKEPRPRDLAAQLTHIEQMLELLLAHHGILPANGTMPAPPDELRAILEPPARKPGASRRRKA